MPIYCFNSVQHVKSIRGSVDAYTQVNYKPPMLNDRWGETLFYIQEKNIYYLQKTFSSCKLSICFAAGSHSVKLNRRISPEINIDTENLVAYLSRLETDCATVGVRIPPAYFVYNKLGKLFTRCSVLDTAKGGLVLGFCFSANRNPLTLKDHSASREFAYIAIHQFANR